MIKLSNLLTEATNDKYVSIGFGRYKEKGKEKDSNAPTFKKEGDKFIPTSTDKGKSTKSTKGTETPKVNIFDKPKKDSSKSTEEPKPEPKKLRQGNPQVNKATKSKAEELGVTPKELGNKEYPLRMLQAAYEALTDSNYHTEARELIAKIEGKPEMAEKPDYPSMRDPQYKEKMAALSQKYASKYSDDVDDNARELGIAASQEAGWDGVQAADAIAFTLRMNGFHKQADMIQSIFDDKPYMKNEGRISLSKLVNEEDDALYVNRIVSRTGLRGPALEKFAKENSINLSKVSDALTSKKLKPMDLMTAIVGYPNNKYAKAIIKAFSK